jgi:hypothetical protein
MTRTDRLRRLLAGRRQRQEIVIRLRSMDEGSAPASSVPADPPGRHQEPMVPRLSDRCLVCGKRDSCGASHSIPQTMRAPSRT